jgi:ElaB/YqjD/DUF883 family membrane-anchored ribosome-binding protein
MLLQSGSKNRQPLIFTFLAARTGIQCRSGARQRLGLNPLQQACCADKPLKQEVEMAENTTSTLLDESQDILHRTEKLLCDAASATGKEAEALQARIIAGLREAKQRLGAAEQIALDKAREAAKVTDAYVHENPWKAIGVGAALGVVVGMLIARR